MTLSAFICDWNGTVIDQRNESPVFRQIARDLFLASIPFHPMRAASILKTRKLIGALYREGRQDAEFDYVVELYRVFNERVIKGLPVSFVQRSVDRYAGIQHTRALLDRRLLRTVDDLHRKGTTTGILSAGYIYGIKTILKAAGYVGLFDFFEANGLQQSGDKAIGIELAIYKNKERALRKLLYERKLDAKRVAYIGDTMDDAGCFRLVGIPIAAFLAPDEIKERFAKEYGAFVPASEADLMKYLEKV